MVETDTDVRECRIKKIEMRCTDFKSVTPKQYRLRIDDKGVKCLLSGIPRKWEQLTPDPDIKLEGLYKKLEKK